MAKRSFDGVNAVILDKGGRVLLGKRSDVPVWALPGGGREHSESPKQAAIREVREETGLDVKVERCVGSYHCSYLGYRDVTHVFLCNIKSGKMKPNYEFLELRFFPPARLPHPLLFIYRERIRDAISGSANIEKVQKITLWRVLSNLRFRPFLLVKLFLFSFRKVF